MLPSGYPGVVRDGTAALNWAGAVMERALKRIPDWIAELDPANEKGLAEAKERARREGRALIWSIPDASSLTQAFTDSRAEVTELGSRLERRTAIEWQSGGATQYFTGVELRILESWADGAGEHLAAWLGEKPQEIRRRQMEFGALGKWLRDYLDSNA
jgi:hypothetical protein